MLAVMSLENEKYVLFTTFRRNGRAVSTPVWLVQMPDGEFGFSTGSESGKAKRLRHTPRVTLQGCDRSGGDAHGPVYDAQARLVTGTALAQVPDRDHGQVRRHGHGARCRRVGRQADRRQTVRV
jgi:PPOX class probable F420-dependent enzyme